MLVVALIKLIPAVIHTLRATLKQLYALAGIFYALALFRKIRDKILLKV